MKSSKKKVYLVYKIASNIQNKIMWMELNNLKGFM